MGGATVILRIGVLLVFLIFFISACASPSQAVPTPQLASTLLPAQPTPFSDLYLRSSGGGEPRTSGYWLLWNTCTEGNQAAVAKANGGRQAGWIVLDDLLEDPGILVGVLKVTSCEQGVNLLQARDLLGADRPDDNAYILASQLMAAQLNLAIGSEYCPASDEAVSAAQLLLLELEFDGQGSYLGPPLASPDLETAKLLAEQLASYNSGTLCQ